MNNHLKEEDLRIIDKRALLKNIATTFELCRPRSSHTGIQAIAYVTHLPIWKVRRSIEGTWQLSFYHWQRIEKAMGKPMWDVFYKHLYSKSNKNEDVYDKN
jgi:hypothetical protein